MSELIELIPMNIRLWRKCQRKAIISASRHANREAPTDSEVCDQYLARYSVTGTNGKMNGLDPESFLTDVLERMVSGCTTNDRLHELLAWNWKAECLAQPSKCAPTIILAG